MVQTESVAFSEELRSALAAAAQIAREQGHAVYTPAHLLKSMLRREYSLLKELEALGVDVFFLEEWAGVRMEECLKMPVPVSPEPDPGIDAVIAEADAVRGMQGRADIDLFCVLAALSTPGVAFSFDQMKSFPVSRAELLRERTAAAGQPHLPASGDSSLQYLYKYCVNRTEPEKSRAHLQEVVAREKELNEIISILCRFSQPNVLLRGYPGTGKSALVKGVVRLIAGGLVPGRLMGTEVFELDMGALLAGASYRGETEDRLKKILAGLALYPNAILVIDGIHVLLDKNTDNAGVSSILKSGLGKGLTLVATTTVDEYSKKIERDEGLCGLLEVVAVEEPDDESAFRMVQSSAQRLKEHHGMAADDETIREAIRLSRRYLKEKSLPESALNLLDQTMSVIKTSGDTFLKEKGRLMERLRRVSHNIGPEQQQEARWLWEDIRRKAHFLLAQEPLPGEAPPEDPALSFEGLERLLARLEATAQVKRAHIAPVDLGAVVAQKTGIPLGKLRSGEKARLQHMEETLKKRVIGQDTAIGIVTEAVLESRSGLRRAGQPIGSFFFLGPTGTGKTELARSLADFLFQDENAIIRFDMSEFKEEHSAALLYGAPPGYVGYEEGGLLVNRIRQKPYSIVLFDEIEKAHPSVFDVFLQILDEGKLHDRLGKEGDFSNAMILFTSNIGAQYIIDSIASGQGCPSSAQLMEIMSGHFRPEFLGRLTEIIPFHPITKAHAMDIFDIHLKKELLDLLEQQRISVNISEAARSYLAANGFNAAYGARPLKGIIRTELRRPLARKIISGEIREGAQVAVDVKENALDWKIG